MNRLFRLLLKACPPSLQRTFEDTHLDEHYSDRDSQGEAPPEHSPAVLSARLDAVEAALKERDEAFARLQAEHRLNHLRLHQPDDTDYKE